jgi:6-pyruvoyl-tetrahydropterin synthase
MGSNACRNLDNSVELLEALSVELNDIMTMNELVLQKSGDLYAQIAACEARQEYVDASLAEGEKIAEEITSDAEQRVRIIVVRAQNVVGPQREQIACIEQEIAELNQEMNREHMKKIKPQPQITDLLSIRREYSLREPQNLENSVNDLLMSQADTPEIEQQPALRREFSLREPQEMDPTEDELEMTTVEQSESTPPPVVKREYSLREPQELDLPEQVPERIAGESAELASPEPDKREYSLREPQELDLPEQVPERIAGESAELASPEPDKREYSLREPEKVDIPEEKPEITEVELSESIMHLDAFVDARRYETIDASNQLIHNHRWQVRVEVEVPMDNHEFVGYGKVSSAVTSTLLRYDDVVLNDVFPFNLIEPRPENVARYFYNCLEDTLTLIDLHLNQISLWENQTLIKQVQTRNTQFDDLLRGEDILKDIRETLSAREQEQPDISFKEMLGNIFKTRL